MEPQHATTAAPSKIDWKRAIFAGLIATAVITVTMALFGQNIVVMLGGMIAPEASTGTQYVLGGMMHLAVGLFYGLLYAWLLGSVRAHGRTLKGLLYGAALAGIALAVMPAASAMMGGGAANPCNPCGQGAAASNPCNPCGEKAGSQNPCNPCNPCGEKAGAQNPCNPCGGQTAGTTANPCNPCGGGGASSGLISLLNHLVYALALAFVYGRAR